jgi:hypothetical protein
MRIWISEDAHLGESAISRELEKAEGLRKLDAIEQAIAATLGRAKAKSHPYGYEPDTGAFDATRCECGCINDISATYCNGCGGEIEIDEHAEKEIYHTPAHMVFAEKHDDGSLEFAGKRYIAATLGTIDKGVPQGADGNLDQAQVDWLRLMPDGWDGTAPDTFGGQPARLTAEQVRELMEDNSRDYQSPTDPYVFITEYDWQAIADELNATLGRGTCEYVIEDNMNETEGMGDVWFRCTNCGTSYDYYADDWLLRMPYCPRCGCEVER